MSSSFNNNNNKTYFKTINEEAVFELVEKKSRFIASVAPVETEKEALEFINKIKKANYKANHNCYAFITKDASRCSDDGEPSGTAGKPMFEMLQKENLENLVVVVTRYFGGTLLGTGGLVRAYGRTAKEGVLAGKIVEMDMYKKVGIQVDYSLSSKITYELDNFQVENTKAILINTDYTENVLFEVYIKLKCVEDYIKNLIEITSGKAVITEKEDVFLKLVDNEIVM